jgi:hypothetical protein
MNQQMKKLLSSLIFALVFLPTTSFAQTGAQGVADYINNLPTNTSNQTSVALSPELQAFLNQATPEQTNSLKSTYGDSSKIRQLYPGINEEDEYYLTFKEGQTLENYLKAITVENGRRAALGQTNFLPNPTVQINPNIQPGAKPEPFTPKNTSNIFPDNGSNSKTSTSLDSNNNILNQIVPSDPFGGQPINKLLNQLFYIGLVVAVLLAIVMIIRGGVEYMTIDAIASKENGKNRVKAAMGGLLLAFSAILILNTINPGLTSLSLRFEQLKQIKGVTVGGVTSGARTGTGVGNFNNAITPTGDGYEVVAGRVAIDTDGTERPPFNDPDWQNQTSFGGLNANTDNYVVVPIGSTIPLGTKVQMYNETTGKTAWGIVGDRGPTANGYGEISLNAARELGAWTEGMGNSANQHKIKYTYYTNEKK